MPVRRKLPGLLTYLEERLGNYVPSAGAEYQFNCPFCIDRIGDESTEPKLWVNLAKHKVFCYRCEYKAGSMKRLFRDLNGGGLRMEELLVLKAEARLIQTSLVDTVREALRGDSLSEFEEEYLKPRRLPQEAKLLSADARPSMWARKAFKYLDSRGVTQDKIDQHRVHYCYQGWHKGHLLFPVYQGGEQIYYTSRFAGTPPAGAPKTKNPKNEEGYVTRKECLLNYDNVIGQPVVAMVEGPFDVMAYEHALGMMGKSLSETHIMLIEALVEEGLEELVISLDPDAVAAVDTIRSEMAGRVPKVSVVHMDYGDPAERHEEIPELLEARQERLSLRDRVKHRIRKPRLRL